MHFLGNPPLPLFRQPIPFRSINRQKSHKFRLVLIYYSGLKKNENPFWQKIVHKDYRILRIILGILTNWKTNFLSSFYLKRGLYRRHNFFQSWSFLLQPANCFVVYTFPPCYFWVITIWLYTWQYFTFVKYRPFYHKKTIFITFFLYYIWSRRQNNLLNNFRRYL